MLERLLTDFKFGVKCEFGWQADNVISWFEEHGCRYAYGYSDKARRHIWKDSVVCMSDGINGKECIPWVIHGKVVEFILYDDFDELVRTTNADVPFPEELI